MRTLGSVWPGSGYEFCQLESDACVGANRGETRAAAGRSAAMSRHFLAWDIERQIELEHIQPGKPTQNAHVEGSYGRLREECLARCRGASSTTNNGRTAVWDIEQPKSLLQR
jgi:transposase InsO family protein